MPHGKLRRSSTDNNNFKGSIPKSLRNCTTLVQSHNFHSDTPSKNVLLDAQYEAHVADFGSARIVLRESSSNWSSFTGIFGYSAPELAYNAAATRSVDMHSLVASEVTTGKHLADLI
ncbi:hypothetical protein FNV43_RR00673 [Rhamnella rubrinervis]|uniref:non-specific serine/threonine protein kinase n=1 Tax=Rhamnella rubrinervis TaxID=2594499 RepID=A0A8K0HQU5_9ROSA|nr:hypothetical protein FNV43_RR00673 [Rhamnella rubrinervis]